MFDFKKLILLLLIIIIFSNFNSLIGQENRTNLLNSGNNKHIHDLQTLPKVIDSVNSSFKKNIFSTDNENKLTLAEHARDSIVTINSDTNDVKYIEEYNNENLLTSRIIQEKRNGQWQNISKYSLEYNPNGYNTKYETFYWTNGSWKKDFRTTYDYDSFGNIIFEIAESYYNDKWENIRKTEKKYNSNNILLYSINYTWENSTWEIQSSERYEYSLLNQIITEETMYHSGVISRTEYKYDNIGRLIEEIYFRNPSNSNELSTSLFKTIKYDTDGYDYISTNFDWLENNWVKSSRTLKHYDNASTIEVEYEYTYQHYISNNWVNDFYNFVKTLEGNHSYEIEKKWDGHKWVNSVQRTTEYSNNMESYIQIYEKWEDSKWIPKDRVRSEKNGRTSIYTREDYINSNWVIYYSDKKSPTIDETYILRRINNTSEKSYYSSKYDYNGNRVLYRAQTLKNEILYNSYEVNSIFDSQDRIMSRESFQWHLNQDSEIHESTSKSYYYYKENQQDILREDQQLKTTYTLSQNFPNPFNPTTVINFRNSKESNINISLYNILGQKVKTITQQHYSKGYHNIMFNSSGFSAGTYFYRLEVEDYAETKKMIILK